MKLNPTTFLQEVLSTVKEYVDKKVSLVSKDLQDFKIKSIEDRHAMHVKSLEEKHELIINMMQKQQGNSHIQKDFVEDVDVEVSEDQRSFKLNIKMSNGDIKEKSFELSNMVYQGVYDTEKNYTKGDTVTHSGSMWVCKSETQDKPGDGNEAWQLCVKRGRDARKEN